MTTTTTPEKKKIDWKQARTVPLMVLSASQIETASHCLRKWWLSKVRKLPGKGSSDSQILGTVLHSVVERYLQADDTGRGPDGNPVDLYPEGWHIARNRYDTSKIDGEATPDKQNKIKILIDKGIKEGILSRRPGRIIEHNFQLSLDKDTRIDGFIDLTYDWKNEVEVEDHKTTKNRRWASTPEALRTNLQMIIYAVERIARLQNLQLPLPAYVTLRHNTYVTADKGLSVIKAEVRIPIEELTVRWQEIRTMIEDMRNVRASAEKWNNIPDPVLGIKACEAYGGCEFLPVCGGRETEEQFLSRLEQWGKPVEKTTIANGEGHASFAWTSPGTSEKPRMTTFAAMMSKGPAPQLVPAIAGTPVSAPVAVAQVKPAPSPFMSVAPSPPVVVRERPWRTEQGWSGSPPWAAEDCQACAGTGFNAAGLVCQICKFEASKKSLEKEDMPESFTCRILGDGTVAWQEQGFEDGWGTTKIAGWKADATSSESVKTVVGTQPAIAPTKKHVGRPRKESVAAPAPEPTQAPAPEPTQAPAPEPTQAPAPAVQSLVPFTLLINCAVSTSRGARMSEYLAGGDIAKVYLKFGEEMAKSCDAESYFHLDPFKRRDMWQSGVALISKELEGKTWVASGVGAHNPDFRAFLDAIRPYAGMVIVAEG